MTDRVWLNRKGIQEYIECMNRTGARNLINEFSSLTIVEKVLNHFPEDFSVPFVIIDNNIVRINYSWIDISLSLVFGILYQTTNMVIDNTPVIMTKETLFESIANSFKQYGFIDYYTHDTFTDDQSTMSEDEINNISELIKSGEMELVMQLLEPYKDV